MVTGIDSWCFSGCEGLTGIIIPNSITSIGYGALEGCSGLSEIYVTNGNPIYDSRDSCNAIIKTADNELISGCKNTIIPNSVTSIGGHAFSGCSGLTSITIPNYVTSIGVCAFEGCSGLTSITIPNYVTSIGGSAFRGCTSLTSITIPNYVTSIGPGTFSECSGLTSITIPNSVTSIGQEAFRGCTSLTSITIPNSVTSIEEGVFRGCSGLVEIYVTNGNPVYDSRNNCNAIIKTTDNELISGCKNTVIPNSVTSIGNGAFEECTSLTSITIPNSVTSIGGSAFSGCSSLTSITLPNSISTIWHFAFASCEGLHEVISLATTPPFLANTAFFDTNCQTLTVPCGCVFAYEFSDWHNYFPNIIEDCSDVAELEDYLAEIYPNPTSGIVKIEAEGIRNISIYNVFGAKVFSELAKGDSFEYDFKKHTAGIYIIRVETAQGIVTKQIVVK